MKPLITIKLAYKLTVTSYWNRGIWLAEGKFVVESLAFVIDISFMKQDPSVVI